MEREVKLKIKITSPDFDCGAPFLISNPVDAVDLMDRHLELIFPSGETLATSDIDLMKDEVELIQFTGLKDMRGADIWEGDILKRPVDCNNELHGDHAFFEVKMQGCVPVLSYLKSEEGWILPRGYLGCCLSDLYDGKMFAFAKDPSKLRPTEDIEVIGNIHCNLELLEVES